MSAGKIQGFILYRIYYRDWVAYLGRTKQPLQTRMRGHLFSKPMHRTIHIDRISKIEYAEFKSESDMNLYEVYFINLWKPPLNVDDKCRDDLTVSLPPIEWKRFDTHLWDKWQEEIAESERKHEMRKHERAAQRELISKMRKDWRKGKITGEEYCTFKESVER